MIALEVVYPWLNKFATTHIRPPSDRLLSQMRMELEQDHPDQAWSLMAQLKSLASKLRDDEEVSEILVACAVGAYKLKDMIEAEALLVDAVSRTWSNIHRRAVVQWMEGCVLWQSVPRRQEAVIAWRNSLADFERLARQPGLPVDQHVWYKDAWCKLGQGLVEAMEEIGQPAKVKKSEANTVPGIPIQSEPVSVSLLPATFTLESTSSTPLPSEPDVTHTSDILQLFTISEEIPAGDFGPSGIDPFPIGTVELSRLSINGHPYSIHSTRGRKVINLPLDQTCTVVKVKGDSMNLENITGEDFVLLRRVDMPVNGDIVMVEIVGTDSSATLKRFFKEKDAITLQPHSSNPVHKPFVFTKVNEGFYIRGVVIAVLKPV